MGEVEVYHAVGRRKNAVARVYLSPGTGEITVNKLAFKEYFQRRSALMIVNQPLELAGLLDKLDIRINVRGGGKSGQVDAVKHGISRALLDYDIELRSTLKAAGFLRRDARVKERKKYGQKGARARFQFSKR